MQEHNEDGQRPPQGRRRRPYRDMTLIFLLIFFSFKAMTDYKVPNKKIQFKFIYRVNEFSLDLLELK